MSSWREGDEHVLTAGDYDFRTKVDIWKSKDDIYRFEWNNRHIYLAEFKTFEECVVYGMNHLARELLSEKLVADKLRSIREMLSVR